MYSGKISLTVISCGSSGGRNKLEPGYPFEGKQVPLFIDTSGITGQAAIATYDTVAGDDDTDRVMPYRTSDRLCGHAREADRKSVV